MCLLPVPIPIIVADLGERDFCEQFYFLSQNVRRIRTGQRAGITYNLPWHFWPLSGAWTAVSTQLAEADVM